MSDDIETLRAKHDAALKAQRAVERERDDAYTVARNEITQRYAEATQTGWANVASAKRALDEAIVAAALAANADMSTHVLVEWRWGREYVGAEKVWRPTGRRGKYEVCTRESAFCRRGPELGEKFLRILKKDGTPALADARVYNGSIAGSGTWLPEGETPAMERARRAELRDDEPDRTAGERE